MSVEDCWRPKRPGPASDKDTVTRQTLRADMCAPPAEKPGPICASVRRIIQQQQLLRAILSLLQLGAREHLAVRYGMVDVLLKEGLAAEASRSDFG